MATLITVGHGGTERRCDAKCYDATSPVCDCVCGGMNHGKGLARAIDNNIKNTEELLKKLNIEFPKKYISINAVQEELFK